MAINRAMFTSNSGVYETPPTIFQPCNREFRFDLDVAALPENAKCERYFTPEDDALTQDWDGRCWCNPPYGVSIGDWIEKAYHESQSNAEIVVCMTPVRSDTDWWHSWQAEAENRLIRKRVRFVGTKSSAPFPSALWVFRKKWWENR